MHYYRGLVLKLDDEKLGYIVKHNDNYYVEIINDPKIVKNINKLRKDK